MTALDWFLRSVAAHPDEPALEAGGTTLTYRQLDAWSAEIAGTLETSGRGPVALAVGRAPWTYAAYLAVLRSGAPVVPFDPAQPAERNRRALVLSEAGLVLTGQDAHAAVSQISPVPVRVVADAPAANPPDPRPRPGPAEDDVAYVLFTSGSTGRPKGIPIRHRQLDEFVRHNVDRYRVGPGSRLSQTFGLTFDPSVFDMFVAWGGGATLVVPSREQLLDPVRFVTERRITHWYSVPSLISVARANGTLTEASMPELSWSLFAGEQLTTDSARLWARAAPGSRVENLYGPTELTVTVTAYRLPSDEARWPRTSNGTVPIGDVYPHLEHRVDPDTGELAVRGSQRFDGYLDPGDNPGRFLTADGGAGGHDGPVPADHWYRTGDRVAVEHGALVHLGRLDTQLKLGGQRVELGDIESAIREHCAVSDVVVVPVGAVLTAVCVGPDTGSDTGSARMRSLLRGRLPAHMIPKRFVARARLPLNPNGKVDRAACAALCGTDGGPAEGGDH